MPSHADLGQAIRRMRRAQGTSIEDLAFAAGRHPTHVSRIERGIANPRLDTMLAIAQALGLTLAALLQTAEGGPANLRSQSVRSVCDY
jgi:transcriptional regulator with XRE-family HTH domain